MQRAAEKNPTEIKKDDAQTRNDVSYPEVNSYASTAEPTSMNVTFNKLDDFNANADNQSEIHPIVYPEMTKRSQFPFYNNREMTSSH